MRQMYVTVGWSLTNSWTLNSGLRPDELLCKTWDYCTYHLRFQSDSKSALLP